MKIGRRTRGDPPRDRGGHSEIYGSRLFPLGAHLKLCEVKRVHKEASAEQEKHGERSLLLSSTIQNFRGALHHSPDRFEVDDGEEGKATSFDILVQVLISCPHIFY